MPGFGVEVVGVEVSRLSDFRGVDGVEGAGGLVDFSLAFSFSPFSVPFSLGRSG